MDIPVFYSERAEQMSAYNAYVKRPERSEGRACNYLLELRQSTE